MHTCFFRLDEISQNVLVESFVNSTTVSWEIKLNNSNTLIDSYRFRYCDVDGPFQNKINSNNSYSVKESQKYNMAKCKVFKKLRYFFLLIIILLFMFMANSLVISGFT